MFTANELLECKAKALEIPAGFRSAMVEEGPNLLLKMADKEMEREGDMEINTGRIKELLFASRAGTDLTEPGATVA